MKEDLMQLLRETPDITSTSQLKDVEHKINHDPRYKAIDSDARKQWFKEYVDDMLKSDFMRLLRETPTIHSTSTWPEARLEIDRDPRFQAVGSDNQREQWFNEYVQDLKRNDELQTGGGIQDEEEVETLSVQEVEVKIKAATLGVIKPKYLAEYDVRPGKYVQISNVVTDKPLNRQ